MSHRKTIDETKLKADYEAGATLMSIADELGVSRMTVRIRLKALGILRSEPYRRRGVGHRQGHAYVYQPDHLKASKNGYVMRAIIVWETVHKESFPEGKEPHHLNGIGTDDTPDNILPLTHAEHTRIETYKRRGKPELAAKLEQELMAQYNGGE